MRRLISSAKTSHSSASSRRPTKKSTPKRLTTPRAREHRADRAARRPGSGADRAPPPGSGSPDRPGWTARRGSGRASRAARPRPADRSGAGRSATRTAGTPGTPRRSRPSRRTCGSSARRSRSEPQNSRWVRLSRIAPAPGDLGIAEERVALAGETVVELQHRPARLGPALLQLDAARPGRRPATRRSSDPSGSGTPASRKTAGCRISCRAARATDRRRSAGCPAGPRACARAAWS